MDQPFTIDLDSGGSVELDPLTGAQFWDLGASKLNESGEVMYRIFTENIRDFRRLPMLDGSEISKDDVPPNELRARLRQAHPLAVRDVVNRASQLAVLTEEERKNSSSQRMSSDTGSTSPAAPATAPEDGSPAPSSTDSASEDG